MYRNKLFPLLKLKENERLQILSESGFERKSNVIFRTLGRPKEPPAIGDQNIQDHLSTSSIFPTVFIVNILPNPNLKGWPRKFLGWVCV